MRGVQAATDEVIGKSTASSVEIPFTDAVFQNILIGKEVLSPKDISSFLVTILNLGISNDKFCGMLAGKCLVIEGVFPRESADSFRALLGYLIPSTYSGLKIDMSRVRFENGTDLCEANLKGASFSGASITGVNFRRTILVEADFRGATLNADVLSGAVLIRADFSGADLTTALVWNIDQRRLVHIDRQYLALNGAKFDDTTKFKV